MGSKELKRNPVQNLVTLALLYFCAALREGHHPGHQVEAVQAGQQGQRPPPHERDLCQAQ